VELVSSNRLLYTVNSDAVHHEAAEHRLQAAHDDDEPIVVSCLWTAVMNGWTAYPRAPPRNRVENTGASLKLAPAETVAAGGLSGDVQLVVLTIESDGCAVLMAPTFNAFPAGTRSIC